MRFEQFEKPPTPPAEKPKETEEREPKEVYINERLDAVRNKLSESFPGIYREVPIKLNYQDQAKDLRIKYSFKKDEITIKTPESLSGQTPEELKEAKTDFLVFKKFAREEKISKKIQDFFFLNHEYIHGIDKSLTREFHPNLKFNLTNITEKSKLIFQPLTHRNSIFMFLGEGFPISIERLMAEKMLKDPQINENDKKEIALFWGKHQESLASQKLERSSDSKYSELDGAMTYYKIYKEFGEKGVLDFIKNYDFKKLNKTKMYSNRKKKILSPACKEFLEMDGKELIENFTKEKPEKEPR